MKLGKKGKEHFTQKHFVQYWFVQNILANMNLVNDIMSCIMFGQILIVQNILVYCQLGPIHICPTDFCQNSLKIHILFALTQFLYKLFSSNNFGTRKFFKNKEIK